MLFAGLARDSASGSITQPADSLKLSKDELLIFFELLQNQHVRNFLSHQKKIRGDSLKLIKPNPWLVSCRAKALIPCLSDAHHRRIF